MRIGSSSTYVRKAAKMKITEIETLPVSVGPGYDYAVLSCSFAPTRG